MIAKEFAGIVKEDIEALVTNAVSEGRTLEYKEQLPKGNDDDTKEFLADVSSLANSGGGDLIYGLREKREAGKTTGLAEAAVGVGSINFGQEELRLLNVLRDAVDPRIPGVQIKNIDGFPSGSVILFRIPKSWASPHMVKFKNASRFFTRTSAGKHQMDVREIRSAFIASQSLADKIAAFRSERVAKILTGETPTKLAEFPKIIFHYLPLRAFSEPVTLDIQAVHNAWDPNLKPMGNVNQYESPRFNLQGLWLSGSGTQRKVDQTIGYIQLFRNGAFESVCLGWTHEKILSGQALEQELMKHGPRYMKLLTELDPGPAFIALSIVSAKGFALMPSLNPDPYLSWHQVTPFQEDALLAPEGLKEESQTNLGVLLKPALDTFWQASGWPGSQGYGEDGKWIGYALRR